MDEESGKVTPKVNARVGSQPHDHTLPWHRAGPVHMRAACGERCEDVTELAGRRELLVCLFFPESHCKDMEVESGCLFLRD